MIAEVLSQVINNPKKMYEEMNIDKAMQNKFDRDRIKASIMSLAKDGAWIGAIDKTATNIAEDRMFEKYLKRELRENPTILEENEIEIRKFYK